MPPHEPHDVSARQAELDPDLLPQRRGPLRHARPRILLVIALGGAAGTPARYGISRIMHVAPGSFPWPTFFVNVTGAFALGVLLTLIVERWPPSLYLRPFAAIGFLGAYTTFSTFSVETDLLVKGGDVGVAIAYVAASLAAGVAATYLGIVIGRLWPAGRGATA
jgi:CrcB protein